MSLFSSTGREDDYVDAKANPRTITTLSATSINQDGFPTDKGTKLRFVMKNRDEVPKEIRVEVSANARLSTYELVRTDRPTDPYRDV